MLPKVIYIMGAPGSGKGTQAELLSQAIGYHRFSTGDAFREVSRQDSELGRKVKETIDNGYLAPPEMAAEIVKTAVQKHIEVGQGLIFDGTPRTVAEAHVVDGFFKEKGYGDPLIIYLKVDRDEMIKRNSKRRFCLGIKGDFPVVTPEDEQKCAEQGGTIGTRPDDDPAKFATRWDQFMTLTNPVLEEYSGRGIVNEVDGMPDVPTVQSCVMEIVRKMGYEG